MRLLSGHVYSPCTCTLHQHGQRWSLARVPLHALSWLLAVAVHSGPTNPSMQMVQSTAACMQGACAGLSTEVEEGIRMPLGTSCMHAARILLGYVGQQAGPQMH